MGIGDLIRNKVLICGLIGWAVAQILKVMIVLIKSRKLDFSRIVGSGGMPSSHSSFVMSIATKIGIEYGFSSGIFALALAFALVVMYDAAGVRRAAGTQAKILNLIIEDLNSKRGIEISRLKELIGHTPFEVLAGALLGIIIGITV